MIRGKKWFGNGIRLLTLAVCALTLCTGIAPAQIGGPGGGIGGGPKGPIGGGIGGVPRLIWRCSRCGAEVAPDAAVCSNCRARLRGGGILPDEEFKSRWTTGSIVFAVVIGIIVVLLVSAVGIAFIVVTVKNNKKSAKWSK